MLSNNLFHKKQIFNFGDGSDSMVAVPQGIMTQAQNAAANVARTRQTVSSNTTGVVEEMARPGHPLPIRQLTGADIQQSMQPDAITGTDTEEIIPIETITDSEQMMQPDALAGTETEPGVTPRVIGTVPGVAGRQPGVARRQSGAAGRQPGVAGSAGRQPGAGTPDGGGGSSVPGELNQANNSSQRFQSNTYAGGEGWYGTLTEFIQNDDIQNLLAQTVTSFVTKGAELFVGPVSSRVVQNPDQPNVATSNFVTPTPGSRASG